jgi:hypothetical protein
MEQQSNTNLSFNIQLDNTAKQYINTMATWAKIIVIVTLITYAMSLVEVISPAEVPASMEKFRANFGFGNNNIIGSLISMAIGLVVCYFLFRFSVQSRKALYSSDQQLLNDSFASLKNYFLILSILMIIMYVFALLVVSFLTISR